MPTESDTYWSALHKALDDAKREVLETGIPALLAVQGIKPGQFVVLVPIQTVDWCEVPKGWIVMYVETGKTGSYKLICDDFIGWVSDTLNLLEELKEDEQ